jgi:hypothetical protein
MTEPNEQYDDNYSFLVNVALAPYEKKDLTPKEAILYNHSVRFQAVICKNGGYGTVAYAARKLVEDAPSNVFLAPILNRELEESTIATAAVELIYGDGYRTMCQRKGGPELKTYRQIGVHISIGFEDEPFDKDMPILMPDDDFWHHVMNVYDPYNGRGIPTVYIHTSPEVMFLHPIKTERQSSIYLSIVNKRGFWTGLIFDGVRAGYPVDLPKTVTRKRKPIEDSSHEAGPEKKKVKPGELSSFQNMVKAQRSNAHTFIVVSDANTEATEEEAEVDAEVDAIAESAKPKSPHKSKEKSKKPEKESKYSRSDKHLVYLIFSFLVIYSSNSKD